MMTVAIDQAADPACVIAHLHQMLVRLPTREVGDDGAEMNMLGRLHGEGVRQIIAE